MRKDEWALFQLRSAGLPRLLQDIDRHKDGGWSQEVCDDVLHMLERFVRAADQDGPTDIWRTCANKELYDFIDKYREWNSRDERTDFSDRVIRRRCHKELLALRRKIRENIRKSQRSSIDVELIVEAYDGFEYLVARHGRRFKSLSTAVEKFQTDERSPASQ